MLLPFDINVDLIYQKDQNVITANLEDKIILV